MRYWYAYTGENLILGHSRTIRQLVPDTPALQRLFEAANEQYARYAAAPYRHAQLVPEETFIAAMIAPLAVQEFGVASPPATSFSSAGQVLRLFDGVDIEQVAVNLFNGRIASAYAESDAAAVTARVAQGFNDGDLFFLPRDAARLHAQETLNTLPGAVVFLLSRSQAERKAFAGYLRRGTSPVVSSDTVAAIAKSRIFLRTSQLRLLRRAGIGRSRRSKDACSYKTHGFRIRKIGYHSSSRRLNTDKNRRHARLAQQQSRQYTRRKIR
jgi:hypothetical protein